MLTVFLLAAICSTGFSYTYPRHVVTELNVTNGGYWGKWHPPSFCADGHYAYGVVLKCTNEDNHGVAHGGEISSGEGEYGDWVGWTECHYGDFITMFALEVEPDQGSGDDTAANYIKFKCRDLAGHQQAYEMVRPPGRGWFGPYGGWSESCPIHTAVCGIQTRIEGPQGGGIHGDDTSLNDVKLFCCNKF